MPGLVEPHIHIVSLANRPGYHTILENTASIREIQEALAARRKDVPEGAWITSMGGWHPNQWAEHRHPTLPSWTRPFPIVPCSCTSASPVPARPTAWARQFFDAADAAPPVHPDIKKINVSPTGAIAAAGFAGGGPSASALFLLRRMQTFADRKRSTIDAMNYSASVGLTTHLDQVLFPTPGPLHPSQILSNLDQYRMYDPWLELHREGKTIIRLQMNFLQNQSDPEFARAEGTSPQPVPVLRRRHDADRRDRRVGGPSRQRRRLARSPAAGRASRLAQRKRACRTSPG